MALKINNNTIIDDNRNIVASGNITINAGIVTASSGIVTYYGDGSKLTGVNSFVSGLLFGL
jgi:lipopolysaccharide export system protein LptA